MSRRDTRQARNYYHDEDHYDRREERLKGEYNHNHDGHYHRRRRDDHRHRLEQPAPKSRAPFKSVALLSVLAITLLCAGAADAKHHLEKPALHYVAAQGSNKPLHVTNNCAETIYPAILTQSGVGPGESGFVLNPQTSKIQIVSADWRGRVWARTNCSFDASREPASGSGGAACQTGDCGQFVQCQGAGNPPATLAEFSLTSNTNQAFYDLSLVDRYNLPMGIISLLGTSTGSNHTDVPPNLTNPVCIGTASLLTPVGDTSDALFGTNSTYPLPLEQTVSTDFVRNWCPWPLLQRPPEKPGNGIYHYPDDKIERPLFNPCFSACAKYNEPGYCCTGKYNSPDTCKPSYYSTQAKRVCPDAYTYAFDDQTSTFIIPAGGGFEIVFCPASRSSNILNTFGDQLRLIAQGGRPVRRVLMAGSDKAHMVNNSHANRAYGLENIVVLVFALIGTFIV